MKHLIYLLLAAVLATACARNPPVRNETNADALTNMPADIPAEELLDGSTLNADRQLVVFEAPGCGFCLLFKEKVLADWQSPVPVGRSSTPQPPIGWSLGQPVFAAPTVVLFESGLEVARFTGFDGDSARFWGWLGQQLLTPEQRRIAFESGTERPFTGPHLNEKRSGSFVDPITGVPLFRSDSKFDSGTGWPSFVRPLPGSVTYHEDRSHGMVRTEVRSASSGIHLGHVFNDGPPPGRTRYCINGHVLHFIPDQVGAIPE